MYGLDNTHMPAPASIPAQVLNLRDLVHRILPFHFGFILSTALEFKFKVWRMQVSLTGFHTSRL